jgi:hypothetical protein
MRNAIDNRNFIPVNRSKNIQTLATLGIVWSEAREEIYKLNYSNYVCGPETDRDDPSSDAFWIFKKVIKEHLIYIKIKILYQKNGGVKVVSFHFDE